MVKALTIKLWRDLRHSFGQVLSISVLIAAGTMLWVIGQTSLLSITTAQQQFYQSQRFADVFAELVRAPQHVEAQLQAIAGVNRVQTRIREPIRIRVAGFEAPIRGEVLSLPDRHPALVNDVHVQRGQRPEPGRADQVLVSEPFALAHGLQPGDRIEVIIRGRQASLTVQGLALSPEFVYSVAPGELMPDHQRYGVLWMPQSGLAMAADMDGAFNSVGLSLQAGASPSDVIAAADRVLHRYGGIGAYSRADQPSHFFIEEELGQLRMMVLVLPLIFLAVAAFLVHVLSDRLVRNQRQQIAALKAFGYDNWAIARHFMAFAMAIALIGVLLSLWPSLWLSRWLIDLYAEYFHFPAWHLRLNVPMFVIAGGIATAAALLGAARAVRLAASEQPAEAMRPPMPARFQRSRWEALLGRHLAQSSRMAVRNMLRHGLKTSVSAAGIGLAFALIVLGLFQFNSVQQMLHTHYHQVMLMDVQVAFDDAVSDQVGAELRALPGVQHVELYREAPVRLRHGHRSERSRLLGIDDSTTLYRLIDAQHRPQSVPTEGLMLTRWLAEALAVEPGDWVELEVLGGRQQQFSMVLAAVVDEPIGAGAYLDRRALNRALKEGPSSSGAWLLIDQRQQAALLAALHDRPRVIGVTHMDEVERTVRGYLDDTFLGFMLVLLGLAAAIAFAVLYNNARMALAERSRELATLRVLGYRDGQVSWVLVAEVLILIMMAIPMSWLLGMGLSWGVQQALSTELFRLPWALNRQMFGLAALSAVLVGLVAALIIYRRVQTIEMVSALKTES